MPTNEEKKRIIKRQIIESVNINRVIEIASDLIRLESEVPPGREGNVGEYVYRFFEKLGFSPTKQYCFKDRFNVIVCIRGDGKLERTVMYNGHLDVVPAGEYSSWQSCPYSPQIRDGKLFGRGASDMKGSIAAAMYMAELLVRNQISFNGDLLYLLDIDEEHSNLGLRTYLSKPVHPDFVIVGEPTNLDIAIGHRGVMAFKVIVKGRSVHAGQAPEGKNAIYGGGCLIKRILDLNNKLAETSFPYMGSPSINVTMIEGGRKVNTIPDRCVLHIDRRIVQGENRESCTSQLMDILDQLRRDTGCEYSFEIVTYCPPGFIEEARYETEVIKKNIVDILKVQPVVKRFEATCEAGMFIERGIPAVVLGPGSISQAHNVNEYIEIEQLVNGVKLYAGVITDLLIAD